MLWSRIFSPTSRTRTVKLSLHQREEATQLKKEQRVDSFECCLLIIILSHPTVEIKMPGELVELAIINRALMLHEHTPLVASLAQIGELIAFRNNHEPCGNIISTLKDELTKIKATVLKQSQEYFSQRLEIARQESNKLLAIDSKFSLSTIKPK